MHVSGSLAQVELLRTFPYFQASSCEHPLPPTVALQVSLADPQGSGPWLYQAVLRVLQAWPEQNATTVSEQLGSSGSDMLGPIFTVAGPFCLLGQQGTGVRHGKVRRLGSHRLSHRQPSGSH